MRVTVHPDGTVVIEYEPAPQDTAGIREVQLDAMVENGTPEPQPFGFTPHPTRTGA